jgi:hypothetical protein
VAKDFGLFNETRDDSGAHIRNRLRAWQSKRLHPLACSSPPHIFPEKIYWQPQANASKRNAVLVSLGRRMSGRSRCGLPCSCFHTSITIADVNTPETSHRWLGRVPPLAPSAAQSHPQHHHAPSQRTPKKRRSAIRTICIESCDGDSEAKDCTGAT